MVRNTASAMNPRVPSLPTIRWASMSTGVSKSSREFSPYPMVFFIENWWRTVRTDAGWSRSRRDSRNNPS